METKVPVNLSKQDKDQIDNLVRLLAKAKIELQGVEVLAASNAMRWLSSMQAFYESELKRLNTPKPISIKETVQPITPPKQVKSKGKKDGNA